MRLLQSSLPDPGKSGTIYGHHQKQRSTDEWDAKEEKETCQWRTTSCWSMRFLQSSLPDPSTRERIYRHHQYFYSTQTSTREKAWQGTAWSNWLLRWGLGHNDEYVTNMRARLIGTKLHHLWRAVQYVWASNATVDGDQRRKKIRKLDRVL